MASFHHMFFLLLWGIPPCTTVTYDEVNQGHTTLPTDIPATVQTINLDENNFPIISDHAFSPYTSLEKLSLSYCEIENVSALAFASTQLEDLNLDFNKLEAPPDLTLVKSSIITLSLSGNPFLGVDSSHFWEQYLRGFIILSSLSLENLGLTAFPNISNVAATLVTLSLAGNDIELVEAEDLIGQSLLVMLENLPVLRYLDLARNDLTAMFDFTPLAASLEELDLRVNDIVISTSDEENLLGMLDMMRSLTTINLNGNLVTSFPNATRTSLELLDLRNNPLVCDCHLIWMRQTIGTTLSIYLSDQPCSEPEPLAVKLWSNIFEDDLCPETTTPTIPITVDPVSLSMTSSRFSPVPMGLAMLSPRGSTLDSNYPGLALDGIYDTCAVTGTSTAPWWAVNMETPVDLIGLHLVGFFATSTNLEVTVTIDNNGDKVLGVGNHLESPTECGRYTIAGSGGDVVVDDDFQCSSQMRGQSVLITFRGDGSVLGQICEVELF